MPSFRALQDAAKLPQLDKMIHSFTGLSYADESLLPTNCFSQTRLIFLLLLLHRDSNLVELFDNVL